MGNTTTNVLETEVALNRRTMIASTIFSIAVASLCLIAESEAQTNCICAYVYAPVCGEDGQTYGNACEAGCAETPVAHNGQCQNAEPDECICMDSWEPVCGADGQTYSNGCRARCANVTVAFEGECSGLRLWLMGLMELFQS